VFDNSKLDRQKKSLMEQAIQIVNDEAPVPQVKTPSRLSLLKSMSKGGKASPSSKSVASSGASSPTASPASSRAPSRASSITSVKSALP
jgi:hypothetical protein